MFFKARCALSETEAVDYGVVVVQTGYLVRWHVEDVCPSHAGARTIRFAERGSFETPVELDPPTLRWFTTKVINAKIFADYLGNI